MTFSQPNEASITNGYETKNLNKATYLLTRGATYKGLRFNWDNEKQRPICDFILDGVNKRHIDEYWKDDMTLEFWTFWRMRMFLKEKILQKQQSKT